MTVQDRKREALRVLGECMEAERLERAPQFCDISERPAGCVLILEARFTDGHVNVTEWSSGHERMLHEHSLRRMYGNRLTGFTRRARWVNPEKMVINLGTPQRKPVVPALVNMR